MNTEKNNLAVCIGKNLKEARRFKNLTQKEVAVKLGMTQQQVANEVGITVRQYQRYESGEKSIYSSSFQVGVRLFKVLRLEIKEFFGFDLEG